MFQLLELEAHCLHLFKDGLVLNGEGGLLCGELAFGDVDFRLEILQLLGACGIGLQQILHTAFLFVEGRQLVLQDAHLRRHVGTAGQCRTDRGFQLLDLQVGLESVDAPQQRPCLIGLSLLNVKTQHFTIAFRRNNDFRGLKDAVGSIIPVLFPATGGKYHDPAHEQAGKSQSQEFMSKLFDTHILI